MAADNFLKIDGIEGESKDSKHPKEIDVPSYSWGVSNAGTMGTGTGGGAGKANMGDFTFMMVTCNASPKLWAFCTNGKHIPSAVFTCRKAGDTPQEFMVYTFTDVLITSYQISGSGELPMESISFNFGKVEYAYSPQKEDGSLAAAQKKTFDVKTNKLT